MARGKTKKKSGANLNPDALGMVRRALLGEGAEMAWRVGTCVIVLALVVAWAMGRAPLQARAAQGVDLAKVVIDTPGDRSASDYGVPATIEHKVMEAVTLDLGHDPFDRASLERLRTELAGTGWFSSIGQVRRLPDNTIRAEATWRIARAFVEHRGVKHLVGDDGAVMDTFGLSGLSGLITILNPRQGVPRDANGRPAFGEKWGLSDVEDGVALVQALRKADLDAYVANIDVRDSDRIVITSLRGAEIVWGGPIGAPQPGEATASERMQALGSVLRDTRRNQPIKWIVRFGNAQSERLIGS